MTEVEEKLVKFAQDMVDWYCDEYGIFHTIKVLHDDYGFTKRELVFDLKFDPNDVEEVIPSE